MNDKLSEIIKDLSEAIFYLVSTIAVIVNLIRKKKSDKSKKRKRS